MLGSSALYSAVPGVPRQMLGSRPGPAPPGRAPRSGAARPEVAVRATAPLSVRDVGKSTNIRWHGAEVPRVEKEKLLGQRGCVLWLTGLSASGKSTLAMRVESALHARGHLTMLLDGDNVRHGLNNNLGFSAEDRAENIRRVGEVAKLASEAGIIAITAFISPYRKDRDAVRGRLAPGDFVEVHLHAPLDLCEARDPKGLYKKARAGQIKNFTGIDDPYEEPLSPEIVLEPYDAQGSERTPDDLCDVVIRTLEGRGIVPGRSKAHLEPRLSVVA